MCCFFYYFILFEKFHKQFYPILIGSYDFFFTNDTIFEQIPLAYFVFCQFLSNFVKFCKKKIQFCQILSNFVKFCQILASFCHDKKIKQKLRFCYFWMTPFELAWHNTPQIDKIPKLVLRHRPLSWVVARAERS